MKVYEICIESTCRDWLTVSAENAEAAADRALDEWCEGNVDMSQLNFTDPEIIYQKEKKGEEP